MSEGLKAWGRLLRLSLAATAIGDVLAGSVLAGASEARFLEIGLLVLASLSVYHGGMAFNDWCDAPGDAKTRPERPIPAGQIRRSSALRVALLLFLVGPLLAALVHPLAGGWLLLLALCAAFYDKRGRGPILGPLLLGICRGMNLSTPLIAFGADGLPLAVWSAPLLYAVYVFLLSRLGRLEDGEGTASTSRTPRNLLVALAVVFWALPWLPLPGVEGTARASALALCLAASWGLLQQARRLTVWQPADLLPAMGCALRRMLPFAAALACLVGSPFGYAVALVILLLYPFSFLLRGVFPPS